MRNPRNVMIALLTVLLAFSVAGNVYLLNHLGNTIQYTVVQEPYYHEYQETVSYSGTGESRGELRVLYVGNSITQHDPCDYWWGDWGMAASNREMDYVHRLGEMLGREYDLSYSLSQLSQWEIMGHDRHEALQLLDGEMKNEFDLVVIQLGENIPQGDTTFSTDFADLVAYIRSLQQVKIYVLANFWPDEEVDRAKQAACDGESVIWVSLDEALEYTVGKGALVGGLDGQEHAVDHDGVAKHPGDEGMKVIAQKLYNAITAG